MVYFNKKYGQHTSGVLFSFWLLLTVCGIPQLQTEIRNTQTKESGTHWLFLLYYVLVLLVFLLNCLPDKPPTETLYSKPSVSKLGISYKLY